VSELLDAVKRFVDSADRFDLNDAAEIIESARKRKADEHRTRLLRVEADGLVVAHFDLNDMAGAFNYLLENVADTGTDVTIRETRIPDSEVAETLATRWWPISGAKNAAAERKEEPNV